MHKCTFLTCLEHPLKSALFLTGNNDADSPSQEPLPNSNFLKGDTLERKSVWKPLIVAEHVYTL